MSWDWEKLKKEHQEPVMTPKANGGAIGAAVGEWLVKKFGKWWAVFCAIALWCIGWLVVGILIKFGFAIADKIMHWFNYM